MGKRSRERAQLMHDPSEQPCLREGDRTQLGGQEGGGEERSQILQGLESYTQESGFILKALGSHRELQGEE